MCKNTVIINRTKNGFVMFCKHCKVFHLTFGHFYLDLNRKELNSLIQYIYNVDTDFWEDFYQDKIIKRKIPIPTQQTNLFLMLNKSELLELKTLLHFKKSKSGYEYLLNSAEIDFKFTVN